MATAPSDLELATSAPRPASFLDSSWTNSSIITALVLLAAYRSLSLIDPAWFMSFPHWLVLTVLGIVPSLFVLIFPLATRHQAPPKRLELPPIGRLAKEAALAILLVIGFLAVLFVVAFVAVLISPDVLETLEATDVFQHAMPTAYMYAFLVVMTTIGPVAEEFFFRGFLFNAFRKRMPFAIAVVASSLIFGFAHSFGLLHSIYASFLGIMLALVYWWRKTIITPIFIHIGINTAAAIGIFVSMQLYAEGPVMGVFPEVRATECVIGGVTPGSPAERAGLLAGDTVIQFGEYSTPDYPSLQDAIKLYQPGDVVEIILLRDGIEMQTTVELATRRALMGPPTPPEPIVP